MYNYFDFYCITPVSSFSYVPDTNKQCKHTTSASCVLTKYMDSNVVAATLSILQAAWCMCEIKPLAFY